MAGLLDILDSEQGRLGLGLLAAAGPRADGAGFGQRVLEGLGSLDAWKKQQAEAKRAAMQEKMYQLQLEEVQRKAAEEKNLRDLASKYMIPAKPAFAGTSNFLGGDLAPMPAAPAQPARFDRDGFAAAYEAQNPIGALPYIQAIQKDDAPVKLGEGEVLLSGKASGYKPIAKGAPKQFTPPAELQMYLYDKENNGIQGTLQDYVMAQKRAGATNVTTKVEQKLGDSLAGQIGPMLKDSYTSANAAVKSADAAQRIISAVDSGKVIAGPLAGGRLKAIQIGQMLGIGGKDDAERVANTRQAIRGLAELTLQGRQQMAGQGAITNQESALAERAMSGDLNDLTPAEVRQLAQASARAAKWQHDMHMSQLENVKKDPATAGLYNFYKPMAFPRMNIEQPLGGASIFDSADAILKK